MAEHLEIAEPLMHAGDAHAGARDDVPAADPVHAARLAARASRRALGADLLLARHVLSTAPITQPREER